MKRQHAMRIASALALILSIGSVVSAMVVAMLGIVGLAGWGDYRYRVELPIPGVSLYAGFQPSWGAVQAGEVCDPVRGDPDLGCYNVVLQKHGPDGIIDDGSAVPQGDVRPVSAEFSGRVFLRAEPGWNSLMASLYGMQVLALLVVAVLFGKLWLFLRATLRGEDLARQVGRLRFIGFALIGWEFVEPLLWVFLSPKAHGYSESTYGPALAFELGSMEPGGPELRMIAFGLLVVLFAEILRGGYGTPKERSQAEVVG